MAFTGTMFALGLLRASKCSLAAGALLSLIACENPSGKPLDLKSIRDSETRLEDTLRQLGGPSSTFNKSHILTYRIGVNGTEYFVEQGSASGMFEYHPVNSEYSLVLEFDDAGVLRRHTFVHLKEPAL
jgi:hypothetical protein